MPRHTTDYLKFLAVAVFVATTPILAAALQIGASAGTDAGVGTSNGSSGQTPDIAVGANTTTGTTSGNTTVGAGTGNNTAATTSSSSDTGGAMTANPHLKSTTGVGTSINTDTRARTGIAGSARTNTGVQRVPTAGHRSRVRGQVNVPNTDVGGSLGVNPHLDTTTTTGTTFNGSGTTQQ